MNTEEAGVERRNGDLCLEAGIAQPKQSPYAAAAQYLQGVITFVKAPLGSAQQKILMPLLGLLLVLEVLAFLAGGVFMVLASRLWMGLGLLSMCAVAAYFLQAVWRDFSEKNHVSLLALLIIFIWLLYCIGNVSVSSVSPEAGLQMAAGINSFSDPGWNYTARAFLGYGNKQYVFGAFPAYLFGRSIFYMHLGFAWPFLMGLMLFYAALRKWAQSSQVATHLAIVPIILFFSFPFIVEYYLIFEQTIYPVAYTLLAVGWFILLIIRPNFLNVLGLFWVGCMLGSCYTPAFATLGLLLFMLGVVCVLLYIKPEKLPFPVENTKNAAAVLTLVVAAMMIFFAASASSGWQERGLARADEAVQWTSVLRNVWAAMFDAQLDFFGMSSGLILVWFILAFAFRLGKINFFISIWALCVLIASFLLKGYTSYDPVSILQRAMVIIPVLLAAMTITSYRIAPHITLNKVDMLIAALFVAGLLEAGVHAYRPNHSFKYLNSISPLKFVLVDIENQIKVNNLDAANARLVFYTDSALMRNVKDYADFLFPGMELFILEREEELASVPESKKPTLFYSTIQNADKNMQYGLKTISVNNLKTGDHEHFGRRVNLNEAAYCAAK